MRCTLPLRLVGILLFLLGARAWAQPGKGEIVPRDAKLEKIFEDGLVLTEGGRCGAELHPIQCTKSC